MIVGCGDATGGASSTGTDTTVAAASTSSSADAGASSAGDGAATGTSGTSGAGTGDEPPVPSDAQWTRLQALRYDDGPPPPDVSNAWADDDDAAALGQALFFDPRFAGRLLDGDNDGSPGTLGHDGEVHRVACASCHVPQDGFVDTRSPHRQISLAAGWVLRRTPGLLEVGSATLLGWGGRRDALYNVAFGAIENAREFNSSRLYVAKQLWANHRAAYEAVFGAMPDFSDATRFGTLAAEDNGCTALDASACAGRPGDGGVYDALAPEDRDAVTRAVVDAGKAMGAYLRRLRCGASRFDAWLDGDATALSAAEIRGAILFVSQGACDGCHGGPMLTDFGFHNIGLVPQTVATVFVDLDDYGASVDLAAAQVDPLGVHGSYADGDDGRLPAVIDDAMLGAFKTPGLRCIAEHPSFMHTGHMSSLAEVVHFHVRGGDPGGYPGTNELEPLALDADDEADLVAFLTALQGPGPDPALLVPP